MVDVVLIPLQRGGGGPVLAFETSLLSSERLKLDLQFGVHTKGWGPNDNYEK